ncbi:MAG: CpsB/CapC family capsule biosynthesis tyrosine phosphatase [Eubacteriales bacterium]
MDLSLDYHAHILPGCDHGSDCLETSLKQVAMAKSAGIRTICATPHFYPHREETDSFLGRRQRAYSFLCPHLSDGDPEVILGAEVLICDGLERLGGLRDLCRQGTDELLVEMPFYQWPKQIWDTLFRLHERKDIRVVIAHADRYPPEDIQILIQENFLLQLNAGCLLTPIKRKRYLSWIESGFAPYLGSDIHMTGTAYRNFAKAQKMICKHLRK